MTAAERPELSAAWARFDAAAERAAAARIVELFVSEPDRLARTSVAAAGLTLDLSKQTWTADGLDACLNLAAAAGVETARARLFAGAAVNASEDRAVLHPALRAGAAARFSAKGEPVSDAVQAGRAKMKALADGIASGAVRGATGERFAAVVHIGIGGSDLGPRLVWEALRPVDAAIELRFAANVDPAEIAAALAGLDPATTLVVAVSKTFTTQETLANAEAARAWLRAALGEAGTTAHFAAVSAAPEKAQAFGVGPDRVFEFWDWVGGRFSVWSAVGLSCAIALGWEAFEEFLAGAALMDAHFVSAPLERNAPVLLALAQVWNRNGLGRGARAVVPYAQRLRLLPAFLQQLEMESNGKRVRADGRPVLRATAPVVFGDAGTNGQHAFFQLLHQGTDVIPVEFVAVARAAEGPADMQTKLLANCLAQGEALAVGRTEADVVAELEARGMAPDAVRTLAPQRTFPGNRPSSLILMETLTPQTLGALLALYEHKVFVEGVIWEINSFDQWGVELGKSLATRILGELEGGDRLPHDPSTAALVQRLR
ncbi:MAG TPA: glucose-6-phosphate isomerase [Caulobacteraceae bacterium]|jgi:glucose-6-phosphate isomerase|nr:glucose-6-phosphate isomerase [Caulobacteraceae bacterium]